MVSSHVWWSMSSHELPIIHDVWPWYNYISAIYDVYLWSVVSALDPVSAISVGPRPIASPTGRQVSGVVGPAVRHLDWGMELVEGDHGLRGQHTEHQLPNHVFIVEYRLVNPMTINVFLLFASLSFRPSWYRHRHLPDYYYYSTVRCRYRHLTPRRDTNRALDNGAVTLVYDYK